MGEVKFRKIDKFYNKFKLDIDKAINSDNPK